MHSLILQLSLSPIPKDEYLKDDVDCVSGGTNAPIIDYVQHITDENRYDALKNSIRELCARIGLRLNPDGESFTFIGGLDDFIRSHVNRIHRLASTVSSYNYFKNLGPRRILEKCIANPLDTSILFVTNFYNQAGYANQSADFLDYIHDLKIGEKLYIGAVLDYRF